MPAEHAGTASLLRPLSPRAWRVVDRRRETDDIVTLRLAAEDGGSFQFRAGQFNMVTAFGVGECAVSMSSRCSETGWVDHTVRQVGAVSRAICAARPDDVLGLRGPFGRDWGVEDETGRDVVVVAGGIGLAPLRGAIYQLLEAGRARRVHVIVGARTPSQLLFDCDLRTWTRMDAHVDVTVDVPAPGWHGNVGLVTSLLAGVDIDGATASAFVCGPEVMMRFVAMALVDRGVPADRVKISLERNMQCGVGWCGHCQLGPLLVCRDGPVVRYAGVVPHLLRERER